jgi:phosphoribosylformimino-5-aminoimidazole carboxamide ribotide isomerase
MIELIPAIDLIDGKCVRLTRGNYDTKKVYGEDPLETAKTFESYGIRRLHVVDLDGARQGRIVHHRVLERLATHTSLIIDFGGGLQSDRDLEIAFDSGARMITGGTVAVKDPEKFTSWLQRFGSRKIILGADAKNGKIAIDGWQNTSGEELIPFLTAYHRQGITQTICTDIGRDGTLQGPATQLYRDIRQALPHIHLIASGGVSSIQDIEQLEAARIPAVILGKALYEGRIQLKDLTHFTDAATD